THRGGSPDSPWWIAGLTVVDRRTHRGETPDSPWGNARLHVGKRPSHRGSVRFGGQAGVRVCTLSWSPGGVPAQPVSARSMKSEAASPGGYTRRARTRVRPHTHAAT